MGVKMVCCNSFSLSPRAKFCPDSREQAPKEGLWRNGCTCKFILPFLGRGRGAAWHRAEHTHRQTPLSSIATSSSSCCYITRPCQWFASTDVKRRPHFSLPQRSREYAKTDPSLIATTAAGSPKTWVPAFGFHPASAGRIDIDVQYPIKAFTLTLMDRGLTSSANKRVHLSELTPSPLPCVIATADGSVRLLQARQSQSALLSPCTCC